MFNKDLFDAICKEHGVRMITGNNPILFVDGEKVEFTKENIKDILLPSKTNYVYSNKHTNIALESTYDFEEYPLAG